MSHSLTNSLFWSHSIRCL